MQITGKNTRVLASIIIPCKNEGTNVKMTADSILAATSLDGIEIIIVDDESVDGCCRFLADDAAYAGIKHLSCPGLGAARARNLGASAAGGEFLIFCDAHITVPEGWLEKLLAAFRRPGVDAVSPAIGSLGNPAATGYGQTWNERLETVWLPPPRNMGITPVPLLPGGCLAVRAGAFRRVEGFDRGFIVWGYEDVELSLKLWLFGFNLYLNPSVKILHLFRKKHPYPVSMNHVHYNLLRMAYSHFKEERIAKIQRQVPSGRLVKRVLDGGVLEQRDRYLRQRKYDDDWFMNRFDIPF
ncbi:MAG: glycosyltransferase family 2 protein [Pelotomaculaceae bacterium]|jgi:glycosyltransferase involved in cell wall biosynthesis|uniref:Putative glycosyl transferase n=1 Tax=anaerobic digester metagenome TaxID=1263854 RepID=A0A485M2X6_9ZZZZ|nr:glycosyltransferase [Bacillota bacterium]